jgi:hypothetical protein
MLSEMVQEHDEPIIKHLLDIKVIFLESNPMVSFGHIVHRYAFTHTTTCMTSLHSCDLVKFCDQ